MSKLNPWIDSDRAREDQNGIIRIAGRDYITQPKLAEILGVTTRTLHRWDTDRVGPPKIKAGRLVLYDAEKIPAWLESRETSAVRLIARRG